MGSAQSSDLQEYTQDKVRISKEKPKDKKSKRKNKDKNANKKLENQYDGRLPGEEENSYDGFFDDIDNRLDDDIEEPFKEELENIAIAEDELKKIIDQVDDEMKEEDGAMKLTVERNARKGSSFSDNTENTNRKEHEKRIGINNRVKFDVKETRRKSEPKNFNTDWTYKQEKIDGFDLEKFKKANVKIKTNKEVHGIDYKVYSVDPYKIDADNNVLESLNHRRIEEKAKVPKYDFNDERLMSQIESEFI